MGKKSVDMRIATEQEMKLAEAAYDLGIWHGVLVKEEMVPGVCGVTRLVVTRRKGPRVPRHFEQFHKLLEEKKLVEDLDTVLGYCEVRLLRTQDDFARYFGFEAITKSEVLQASFKLGKPLLFIAGCGWLHERKAFNALLHAVLKRAQDADLSVVVTGNEMVTAVFDDACYAFGYASVSDAGPDFFSILSGVSVMHSLANLRKKSREAHWSGEMPAIFDVK